MRTEVKAGIVIGLVLITGTIIWSLSRGDGEQGKAEVPFDRTSAESATPDRTTPDRTAQRNQPNSGARRSVDRPTAARDARPPTNRTATPVADGPAPNRGRDEALHPVDSGAQPLVLRPPASDEPSTPDPTVATPVGSTRTPDANAAPARNSSTSDPTEVASSDTTATRAPRRDLTSPSRSAPPARARGTTHKIEPADTLAYIAREKYGHEKYWKQIQAANPGLDPQRLQVGKVIVLPPKEDVVSSARPATASARPTEGRVPGTSDKTTYVVGRGDTLTGIARNVLGDGKRWKEIYELNKDRLSSPDLVTEGTELRLPPARRT